MKEILFNNNKYNIPQCWEDVSVKMIIDANTLSDILDDAPIIAILAAYTGIPIERLKHGEVKAINEILEVMNFITVPYEPKPTNKFLFKNDYYIAEEDLVNQKFEDFVSVQTCLYNYRDEPHKGLPRLLAIYCKKEGEVLDDFDLTERATYFNELPMTIAKDVEAFFLHSLNAYNALTLLSSTQSQLEELVLNKVSELENTMKAYKGRTGMSFYTKLVIGIYLLQLWWVKKVLVRYCNSKPLKPSKNNSNRIYKKLLSRFRREKDKSYIKK